MTKPEFPANSVFNDNEWFCLSCKSKVKTCYCPWVGIRALHDKFDHSLVHIRLDGHQQRLNAIEERLKAVETISKAWRPVMNSDFLVDTPSDQSNSVRDKEIEELKFKLNIRDNIIKNQTALISALNNSLDMKQKKIVDLSTNLHTMHHPLA